MAGAAGCPTEVRFDPAAPGGVLDAGWQGLAHGKPVADCGAADTCRHFLSPPQSFAAGGVPYCALLEVAGSVGGSVDVEGGTTTSPAPA